MRQVVTKSPRALAHLEMKQSMQHLVRNADGDELVHTQRRRPLIL
jgi:hypothetical protein